MDSSKRTQRAVIQFLVKEGNTATDIFGRMQMVYWNECLACSMVFKWCKEFECGRETTMDLPRPSQAHAAITLDTIAEVDTLVKVNRRITVSKLAAAIGISRGSIGTILHKELGYSKVGAQWVPNHLTEDQIALLMDLSLQHFMCYQEEGSTFLSKIVAGDEHGAIILSQQQNA
jgi:hypothetical protein